MGRLVIGALILERPGERCTPAVLLVGDYRLLRTLYSLIHTRPAPFDFTERQYGDGQPIAGRGVEKIDIAKLETGDAHRPYLFQKLS